MKVVFSAKADQDLAELFKYIDNNLHNNIAAHNIIDKLLRVAKQLSTFPEMGTSLTPLNRLDKYRYLIIDNYLLIYRIMDKKVFVVRILYARSDYVRLLQG